jgi:putative transposase
LSAQRDTTGRRESKSETHPEGVPERDAQMPSTHTSLHVHAVFSTKDRFPSIENDWTPRLHAYMGGTLNGLGAKPLSIGGVSDHVHLLIGLKPTQAVSDVVRELKKASSTWVHEEIGRTKFAWQEGYGAFSVSHANIEKVREYISAQGEHHKKRSFQDEYRDFLELNGIEFDERYLW